MLRDRAYAGIRRRNRLGTVFSYGCPDGVFKRVMLSDRICHQRISQGTQFESYERFLPPVSCGPQTDILSDTAAISHAV